MCVYGMQYIPVCKIQSKLQDNLAKLAALSELVLVQHKLTSPFSRGGQRSRFVSESSCWKRTSVERSHSWSTGTTVAATAKKRATKKMAGARAASQKNCERRKRVQFLLPEPPKKPTLGQMIFDREKGTFLGRTPKTWAQFMVFYAIFYAFLASLFWICIQVLLDGISMTEPKLQLERSLIGANPGLTVRPQLIHVEGPMVIAIDSKNPSNNDNWIELIDDFLNAYDNTTVDRKNCEFGDIQRPSDVCLVDMESFEGCSKANSYGYKTNEPCVFIKLNRIFGWKPETYDMPLEEMPEDLQAHINETIYEERKQIWLSCKASQVGALAQGHNKDNFDNISYSHGRGFPAYYYPYLNQPGYLSPLIPVQFKSLPQGQVLDVECRAWAKNIIYKAAPGDRMGSVAFQIIVN
ncbi:sodium/potassium-transporting ATPase subunit beta-1-like isoform X1 [Drosophila pseudoobscura]|uniref:Sodium/potassium-transporting ATPase subunit beta-1-like isoform X1 n=2 Tax=Drosophila pseudoobscura pseudoobscura TaxID=46245 RepID=A0A6I8UYQ3_DROPS|nr:sodium/potassium-transporting ATPase subunit beta-1 isoform X1 [Drosophila pseudoobscura]